jgi:hypothetical protein
MILVCKVCLFLKTREFKKHVNSEKSAWPTKTNFPSLQIIQEGTKKIIWNKNFNFTFRHTVKIELQILKVYNYWL